MESDINDAQVTGLLASPLFSQEREASADHLKVITLEEKILDKAHNRSNQTLGNQWRASSTGAQGNPSHCFHKKKFISEVQSNEERFCAGSPEAQKLLNSRAEGEQEALPELSEAESHTKILLEEQRNHILSEAKFELDLLWRGELKERLHRYNF